MAQLQRHQEPSSREIDPSCKIIMLLIAPAHSDTPWTQACFHHFPAALPFSPPPGWAVVGASLLAEEEEPQSLGREKLNLPVNFGLQIRAERVWAPLLLPRFGCVPGAGWVLSACPLPSEFPFQKGSWLCPSVNHDGLGPLVPNK